MLRNIYVELGKIKNARQEVKKLMVKAPEGNLRCAVNKGYYQYYLGKEYLGKEKRELILRIAKKEYAQQLDKKLAEYEEKLEAIKHLYEREEAENIYRNLHPARKKLIEPIIKPVEELIEVFENIEYMGKEFPLEDKTEFYTNKGERVRSKSEKIIADELFRNKIPYHYELPLEVENWKKKIWIYPDFTALNKRTGKRWIMEHLGMMDKPSYCETAMQKLSTYEKNGFLLGDGLILLHETSTEPLNINTVKKYIEKYLL